MISLKEGGKRRVTPTSEGVWENVFEKRTNKYFNDLEGELDGRSWGSSRKKLRYRKRKEAGKKDQERGRRKNAPRWANIKKGRAGKLP